jgi:hypothetical protein
MTTPNRDPRTDLNERIEAPTESRGYDGEVVPSTSNPGYAEQPGASPEGGGYVGQQGVSPEGGGYATQPEGGGYAAQPEGGGYATQPEGGAFREQPAAMPESAERVVPAPVGPGYSAEPQVSPDSGGYAERVGPSSGNGGDGERLDTSIDTGRRTDVTGSSHRGGEEPENSSVQGLFAETELSDLRSRWGDVQAGFVDDPRECIQKADGLVSDVVEQLTTGIAGARARLESQWSRGEQASTEDLRVALMRYREFFERLLAV